MSTRTHDDPRYGASLQPIALMLIVGTLELIIWGWCNIQQITTTHDAIFGLLQGATTVVGLSGRQALAAVQGNLGKNHQIAYTIAFVTQIVFLMSSFSLSHVWSQMVARQGYHPTGHGFKAHVTEIKRHLSLRRCVFIVFFISDVLADLRYVQSSSSDWMVPLLYILAMWIGSTLVGLDGWQRVSGAFMVWMNTQRFNQHHQSSRDKQAEEEL